MKIYVGNMPFSMTEDQLRGLFEAYGKVDSVNVVMNRETGRSRGFGFVEMGNADEARKAIDALNSQDCEGRPLNVNEARPREDRGPRRNGGGGGGGGRGRF